MAQGTAVAESRKVGDAGLVTVGIDVSDRYSRPCGSDDSHGSLAVRGFGLSLSGTLMGGYSSGIRGAASSVNDSLNAGSTGR